ncbi:protease inhibitor Inh [Azorhizobium sp. AG788]|uniref:protease inhibitor Inh/omp19 family protein n=1 Tax=Azorhizobium sp. AG788 TaxID=2183897 RepID=UPI0010613B45|nr:protease inhibitor Inh/omp19 family protein [Azorhizobium sp. AG788]TDT89382.1 protease inhibitor Inh [Azorhizobium sp. AG788]
MRIAGRRRPASRPVWAGAAVLMVSAVLVGALPAFSQSAKPVPPAAVPAPGAKAPAPRTPDAASPKPPATGLRAEAEKKAGALALASADGERTCPLELKTTAAPGGFAIGFDAACAAIPFTTQTVAWTPDPSGSILFLSAQGRTIAEFTEGAGGAYEALREGDGVYFLAPPSVLAEDLVRPEEIIGDWNLARVAGTPICRWTFLETPVPGGFSVTAAPGCDGFGGFVPKAWHLEGGNVVVTAATGNGLVRFARQEDGGWAKVPERGRPLLMMRP